MTLGRWIRGVVIVVSVAGSLVGGASMAYAQGPVQPVVPTAGAAQQTRTPTGPPNNDPTPPAVVAPTREPVATRVAQPTAAQPTAAQDTPAQDDTPTTEPAPATTATAQPQVVAPVVPTLTPAQIARQQAQLARRAAQRAAAAASARSAWNKHDNASRMIIVRSRTVDTVFGGVLQNQIVRTEGRLTLEALAGYLPDSWLSISNGTASLAATIVLTPGTSADFGGAVHDLKLVGGANVAGAAAIYTGGGRLALHDIAVGSADVNTGAVMPAGAGRPFIVVAKGGRLDATDATIGDLGTSVTDPHGQPGLFFTSGSTGSLVRTSVLRNSTGPKLVGSQGVRLDGLTVSDSTTDGLVLQGDTGTTMKAVKSTGNKGNGVLVSGPTSARPLTDITTENNGGYGLAVVGQSKPQISGITTTGDAAGGLRLNRTTDATVTDVTTTNEPIGVYAHVGSARVTLDKVKVTGGRRGVVLDKTTSAMTLKDSTIASATVVGIDLGGKKVELNGVQVSDSRSAVRIERGADGIAATGMTVTGGADGIVVSPGTSHISIQDLTASGVRNDSIRTLSAGATITGGSITGGATGIDVAAATTITGTAVSETNVGIRASSTDLVRAEKVDIAAIAIGITVDPGANFVLANSQVRALEAVRGTLIQEGVNDLSLPPLNLLAAIGLPLVLFALLLEVLHVLRQRAVGGTRRRQAPPLVAVPAGVG